MGLPLYLFSWMSEAVDEEVGGVADLLRVRA